MNTKKNPALADRLVKHRKKKSDQYDKNFAVNPKNKISPREPYLAIYSFENDAPC